jgi:hypothetical protein
MDWNSFATGWFTGCGVTILVCMYLSWCDHREWCGILDRAIALIEELRRRNPESEARDG